MCPRFLNVHKMLCSAALASCTRINGMSIIFLSIFLKIFEICDLMESHVSQILLTFFNGGYLNDVPKANPQGLFLRQLECVIFVVAFI